MPKATVAGETETAVDGCFGSGGEGDIEERTREWAVPISRSGGGLSDEKLHHKVCICKVLVSRKIPRVTEMQDLSCIGGKIDNDLVAFRDGEDDVRCADWAGGEAGVGADYV